MKKKSDGRLMKRASYALLALVMAAAMSACGSKKEEEPVAEQTVAEAEQAVRENAPDAAAQAEEAAKEEAAKEEAAKEEAAKEEAAVSEAAEKEQAAEKPGTEEDQQETEVIKKPEPAADGSGEDKDNKKKKKESKKDSGSDAPQGLAMLDGKMTFDGMELEFPIELESMKLGNWKIEYRDVDDPAGKMLAPAEIVTAVMTNDSFSTDDVTVVAEFGNYSNEETALSDIPMTGIYLTKGKGKDGKEPVLPEVVLPGKLTWGSKDEEIRGLFGEASFSGSFFDKDFDHMYENGSYMIELGGMNDTGIEYIVYCVE